MKQLTRGILIVVEGIDGAGKSTLTKGIYEHLIAHNFSCHVTREPGATVLGKQLRAMLHDRDFQMGYQAEFLLFAADRAQHFQEIVVPALDQKKIVISDRMADSSLVYQGYGRELDITMIKKINDWVMQSIVPDITIYLRLSPEKAAERLNARPGSKSSFEKEHASFMQRVADGFDEIYAGRDDVIVLDAKLEPAVLVATAVAQIMRRIEEVNDRSKSPES